MWVRVATFEGVDPEKANAILKERMASGEMAPAVGMNSVLILDDKDTKKRKFFAFFDSKDAITAAEPGFEQQGDTIPEDVRGKRTSVHYYEVVIHDGDIDQANAARVFLADVLRNVVELRHLPAVLAQDFLVSRHRTHARDLTRMRVRSRFLV